MDWFTKMFISEAKPALQRHSGSGGTVEVIPDTLILVDENGVEVVAVMTDEEVDLTATANDIRLGVVAVTDEGIVTGTHKCE